MENLYKTVPYVQLFRMDLGFAVSSTLPIGMSAKYLDYVREQSVDGGIP
jgi:hypothetical protein